MVACQMVARQVVSRRQARRFAMRLMGAGWLVPAFLTTIGCSDETPGSLPVEAGADAGNDRSETPVESSVVDAISEKNDATATTAWSVSTQGQYATMPALGPDGTIYFGSWDGRLYAVNNVGTVLWTYATQGRIDCPPVVAEGRVFVSSWDGGLYSITTTGSLDFRFETGAPVDVSVAVDDKGIVYVTSEKPQLSAVRASDAKPLWSAVLGAAPTTAPVIDVAPQGTRILVGTADGKLHTFSPAGAEAPAVQLPSADGHAETALALSADGAVYAGTSQGHVVGISSSGALTFDLAITYPEAAVFSPVVASDGTLFVGATDRTLYAITAEGALRWSKSAGGSILSGPTLGTDGQVYVGAKGIIRATSGGSIERLVTLPIDGAPILLPDGTWYANMLTGALASGHLPQPVGLATAVWPTQQGGYDRRGMRQR
jgi:outer membrane protein assembly factor BamB